MPADPTTSTSRLRAARRACAHGLACLLWFIGALLPAHAAPASSGTTVQFSGASVANCSLSGTTYTCARLPLASASDFMSIGSGYTVNIGADTTFGYNQGLIMTGTARLSVTGDLDIGDIAPGNLNVSGGTLATTGNFAVGAQQQTLTADISAATANLGTGSTLVINGDVAVTGTVAVASHATINGALSGSAITTSSPVTLNGNITASTSFTLASGSTVTGNIKAPVVVLNPSRSTVTGSITASTSLRIGSSDTVNGDVTTASLTMDSSNATVTGNATVGTADLEYAAKVNKTIYCTGGTASGRCDCVTNNSGTASFQPNGPTCASVTPPNVLDHLLVTHDGTASACTSDPVTVKACANAACTSVYTGGLTATLAPGGSSFTIPASGTGTGDIKYVGTGTVAITVASSSQAPAAALQCQNTQAGTHSCNVQVNGNVGLALTIPDQQADARTQGTLAATVYDNASKSCVAAFASQTKSVKLACGYTNPTSGTLPVLANFDGSTTVYGALNGANSAAAACDTAGRTYAVAFNASGSANVYMRYADVGAVTVTASTPNDVTTAGGDTIIVAPAKFKLTPPAPTVTTAGKPFTAMGSALTVNGAVAPNFGNETTPEGLTFGALGTFPNCIVTGSSLSQGAATWSAAGVTQQLTYPEAGAFTLIVMQKSSNYLSGTVAAPGPVTFGSPTTCGNITSLPAYFEVKPGRTAAAGQYYYSGQPIDFTVTAKNAAGGTTQNYDPTGSNSKAVTLAAFDAAGATLLPQTTGTLSTVTLAASTFSKGVSTVTAAAASPVTYKFAGFATAPTTLRLRATDTNNVSSGAAAAGEFATVIRSGRIRIGNAFGTKGSNLVLPVAFEYYTGTNWLRNVSETGATIPAAAIGIGFVPLVAAVPAPSSPTNGNSGTGAVVFTQGLSSLTLRPGSAAGTAYVVFNLGTTSTSVSCLGTNQPTTGAGASLAYLRSANGVCVGATPANPADPVARATFGIFSPETRRIIHAREVFN